MIGLCFGMQWERRVAELFKGFSAHASATRSSSY